jgi:ribosomal protein L29
MLQELDGYIDPSDEPSSSVVDVNESALNAVKQSIAAAQTTASTVDYKAARALNTAQDAQTTANNLRKELAALQAQVNAMQSAYAKNANSQELADLVWAKLWDTVYLLRMGMNSGSRDANVQAWVSDLTSFIKRVK